MAWRESRCHWCIQQLILVPSPLVNKLSAEVVEMETCWNQHINKARQMCSWKSSMDRFCGFCGQGGHLQVCGACKQIWYCCKKHQVAHWRTHKPTCKASVKETGGREPSRGGHDGNTVTPGSARSEPEVGTDNHAHEQHTLQEGPGFEASTVGPSSPGSELEDSCIECGHDLDKMTISNQEHTSPLGPVSGVHNTNFPPPEFYIADNSNGATSNISHGKISSRSDSRKSARAACSPVAGERQRRSSTDSGRNIADYIVKCMNDYGICVVDNFLGDDRSLMLLQEVNELNEAGALSDGQLVSSDHPGEITKKVRGDKITWVEVGDSGAQNIGLLIQRIDKLILKCNGKLGRYNINGRTKVSEILPIILVRLTHWA